MQFLFGMILGAALAFGLAVWWYSGRLKPRLVALRERIADKLDGWFGR